jgi:hypothetical protein
MQEFWYICLDMPKPEKRIQKKALAKIGRALQSEEALSFADTLNEGRYALYWNHDGRQERVDTRVLTVVIGRLREAETLNERIDDHYRESIKKGLIREKKGNSSGETLIEHVGPAKSQFERYFRALLKTEDSINRILSRYSATPKLNVRDGCIVDWVQQDTKRATSAELAFLLEIVRLAEEGRLSSIRQCSHCHKWIVAKFSHQRFCSEGCKLKFHTLNEGDKKLRRDWARKNYWNQKRQRQK